MEKCNKSKSSLELDGIISIFIILIIIAIVFIAIFLFKNFEYQRYKYTAYIKLPNNEICMKEFRDYDITGSMITLTFADGTKITVNTKNVTLVKSRKEIYNGR